jgi:hypothetical protein
MEKIGLLRARRTNYLSSSLNINLTLNHNGSFSSWESWQKTWVSQCLANHVKTPVAMEMWGNCGR